MTNNERRFKEIIDEYDIHSRYIETIRETALQLNLSRDASKGLVIIEAYVGNYQHLLKISEKKLIFLVSFSSVHEYEKCQVIIASYHMIMHVEHNSLLLGPYIMNWEGIINPCLNKDSELGYYVVAKIYGMEITVLRRMNETVRISNDII